MEGLTKAFDPIEAERILTTVLRDVKEGHFKGQIIIFRDRQAVTMVEVIIKDITPIERVTMLYNLFSQYADLEKRLFMDLIFEESIRSIWHGGR